MAHFPPKIRCRIGFCKPFQAGRGVRIHHSAGCEQESRKESVKRAVKGSLNGVLFSQIRRWIGFCKPFQAGREKISNSIAGKGKTITPGRARQSRREGCESAPPGCFFAFFASFHSRSAFASERSARRKTDQRYRQSRKRGFGARRDESGETYKICTKKTEYSLIFYIKMGLTSTRKCGIIT